MPYFINKNINVPIIAFCFISSSITNSCSVAFFTSASSATLIFSFLISWYLKLTLYSNSCSGSKFSILTYLFPMFTSLRVENSKLKQELVQAKAEIENLKRQVAIQAVRNQKRGGKTNGNQEN